MHGPPIKFHPIAPLHILVAHRYGITYWQETASRGGLYSEFLVHGLSHLDSIHSNICPLQWITIDVQMPRSLISFSGVVCVSIFIFCVVESSLFILISFIRVYHVVWLNRFFYVLLSITWRGPFRCIDTSIHYKSMRLFFHYLDRIFAFVIGKILCRYSPHSCWRKNTTNFVKTFFPNQMIFLFSISIHWMLFKSK